jgi:hypothetical protein
MPPHCSLPEPAVVEFGEINLSLRSWRPLTVARKNHQMQSLTPLMLETEDFQRERLLVHHVGKGLEIPAGSRQIAAGTLSVGHKEPSPPGMPGQ